MKDDDQENLNDFIKADRKQYLADFAAKNRRPRMTWTTIPFGVALLLTAGMVWGIPENWAQTRPPIEVFGTYIAMICSLVGLLFSTQGPDGFNAPRPKFLKKFK